MALARLPLAIEHDYCERKQCLGLDHYEGHSYPPHHRLTCVTISLTPF